MAVVFTSTTRLRKRPVSIVTDDGLEQKAKTELIEEMDILGRQPWTPNSWGQARTTFLFYFTAPDWTLVLGAPFPLLLPSRLLIMGPNNLTSTTSLQCIQGQGQHHFQLAMLYDCTSIADSPQKVAQEPGTSLWLATCVCAKFRGGFI
jgi:hypothetical protein